jgi:hypothetical protein
MFNIFFFQYVRNMLSSLLLNKLFIHQFADPPILVINPSYTPSVYFNIPFLLRKKPFQFSWEWLLKSEISMYMTKKALLYFFAHFARKKGGDVVHFSGFRPKNEPLSPFFRTNKASAKGICLFIMYFTEIYYLFFTLVQVKYQATKNIATVKTHLLNTS